ncbi:MAG: S-methyl-5-thioribose-1-phosphate isomerase [Candidatus Woesearchaeota archaeon]
MSLDQVVKDIESLKIQGAATIAKAAVDAFKKEAQKCKVKSRGGYLKEMHSAKNKLIASRPTEPKMRNALKYILSKMKGKTPLELKKEIVDKADEVLQHFHEVKDSIAHQGSLKIHNGMIVFTHCHSSTVIGILKYAKQKHKKFFVRNTETRPLFQGRMTAREIAKLDIPIKHYVDSAGMLALKDADIMLIGADAITAKGEVINKIGSRLLAEVADFYGVKVYVCTDSWAYDPETKIHPEIIEQRDPSEVWENRPNGVKVMNPAFEIIPPELISGIISELGVFKPEHFLYKVKRHYKWLK